MDRIIDTAAAFGIGPVVAYGPATGGISESYRVETPHGVFHFKQWDGSDAELELIAELDSSLHAEGIGAAPFLTTADGAYRAPTGYVATPWLAGAPRHDHSSESIRSFGAFFARYNLVLRDLPPPVWLAHRWSPWDQADNIRWMLGECAPRLDEMALPPYQREVCAAVYTALAAQQEVIRQLSRQLVHGDANDSNALFAGDQCIAIIDFTPYYESHAYSFAVMAYHWCAYGRAHPDRPRLLSLYHSYRELYPWTPAEIDAFPALMLRAIGRMLAVPMAFWLASPSPRTPLQIHPEELATCAMVLKHLGYFALPSE